MDSFYSTLDNLGYSHFERNDFKLTKRLGSGYVGEVYEGLLTLIDHKIPIAAKKLSSHSYDNGKIDDYLYNDVVDELKIGAKFIEKANYLIQFYGYCRVEKQEEVQLFILMEKTKGCDLAKYLYEDEFWTRLTKEQYDTSESITTLRHEGSYWDYTMKRNHKIDIMKHLATAIKELHSYKIVHSDIKAQNMLWVGDHIKLIDFNASVEMGDKTVIKGRREQGTPGYMAKEMYDGMIGYSSDIYSFGVCCLEVWFGDIWPTKSDSYRKNRRYVTDYLSLLEDEEPEVYNLIKRCISVDSKKRPSITEIIHLLNHDK